MAPDPPIQSTVRRSKRRSVISPPDPPIPPKIDGSEAIEAQASKRRKQSVQKKKKSAVKASGNANGDGSGEIEFQIENEEEEEEENEERVEEPVILKQRKGVAVVRGSKKDQGEGEEDDCFLGDPVPEKEARERWPHRYPDENAKEQVQIQKSNEQTDVLKARHHFLQAKVDGIIYSVNDDAYVKAEKGEPDYICRILEFFETCDKGLYFTAQWFFRAKDTVIKEHAHYHDERRVFLSDDRNDNALNCLVKKIRVVHVTPEIDFPFKDKDISSCDLYYDMSFSVAYSSFTSIPSEVEVEGIDTTSSIASCGSSNVTEDRPTTKVSKETTVLSMLDLFSGCGAMSTGLCLGANLSGVDLQTCWAVDMNRNACDSLKYNHPETEVRNEKAEDFLSVLREWKSLCEEYGLGHGSSYSPQMDSVVDEEDTEPSNLPSGVFEVGKIIGICYGKTANVDKVGLKFKVRWKGYGPDEDTWEPIDNLSDCLERIREFVRHGYMRNILPLPGSVDVICGGPPCQGISGFNRFRKHDDPLKDEKNAQMLVFMEIVEFLKPKFVLMENVVDILKFSSGFLGRYALSRLVAMKYQARLGILAAGNYGLPQYRMRVFLWGARPTEKLPQFPLPTHEVVTRGSPPVEFETHVVAYDGSQHRKLENALLLADAISDLPLVGNNETRDEIDYEGPPVNDFQRYIRFTKDDMMLRGPFEEKHSQNGKIFDHRPLPLNENDFQRVCHIPKQKGANFRNLPGVMVGAGNVVEWDPDVPRVLLPSGKPLVPDYAMSFKNGKTLKPFGRLWWDETVSTVVTRAEPHNQIIIHPDQDRVLTIRENARLQGFPDYYRLFGPIKERYIQVGNAVAVPVSRALGYGLGLAFLGDADDEPVFALPQNFPLNS